MRSTEMRACSESNSLASLLQSVLVRTTSFNVSHHSHCVRSKTDGRSDYEDDWAIVQTSNFSTLFLLSREQNPPEADIDVSLTTSLALEIDLTCTLSGLVATSGTSWVELGLSHQNKPDRLLIYLTAFVQFCR